MGRHRRFYNRGVLQSETGFRKYSAVIHMESVLERDKICGRDTGKKGHNKMKKVLKQPGQQRGEEKRGS